MDPIAALPRYNLIRPLAGTPGVAMYIIRQISVACLISFIVLVIGGENGACEGLGTFIEYSYNHNPEILAEREAVRIADEEYGQANSAFEPTASFALQGGNYYDKFLGEHFWGPTQSPSITLSLPIFSGGRLSEKIDQSGLKILAAREKLRAKEIEVELKTIEAYVGAVRDRDLLEIDSDDGAQLAQLLDLTEVRLKQRAATKIDEAMAAARVAQSKMQHLDSEAALATTLAQLTSISGENVGKLEPLTQQPTAPSTLDEAINIGLSNSPIIRMAIYTEAISKAGIAIAKAARAPNIEIDLSAQRSLYQYFLKHEYQDQASVILNVHQPLWSSGAISSQIRQSEDENSRDRLSLEDTKNKIIRNISEDFIRFQSLRRKTPILIDNFNNYDYIYEHTRDNRNVLQRTMAEVINAKLQVTNAKFELVRLRAEEYIACVKLLSDMGTLSQSTFVSNANIYDMYAHLGRTIRSTSSPLSLPGRFLDRSALRLESVPSPLNLIPGHDDTLRGRPSSGKVNQESDPTLPIGAPQ